MSAPPTVPTNLRPYAGPIATTGINLSSYVGWGTTYADQSDWVNAPVGQTFETEQKPGWYGEISQQDSTQSYHLQTRLGEGELGLLVDPGSIGNLGGDAWAQDVAKVAIQSGRKPQQVKRDRPLKVSGVGHGSQSASHNCILPSCFQKLDGSYHSGSFEAPIVKDSDLPGLLGLTSLKNRRAILDLVTNQLHFLGPGDYDLMTALPPGTETFQLKHAPSGHLILPCNKFQEFDKEQANGKFTLDETPLTLLAKSEL